MKRVLAIWLPNWPAQRRGWGPRDHTDREALVTLAQWCHRFGPTVGLEESETPETLLLDATNLALLYGSEEELVRQVDQGMKRCRLEAQLAVADTIGAAWGLAHYGDESLTELPLPALRLDEELLDTLTALGVENIGQVLALPREQLRSRFGPQLLWRVDQLLGAAAETMDAAPPSEDVVAEQEFEFPLADRAALEHIAAELMTRLAWFLNARCEGALAIACRIACEEAPAVECEIGLFHPSASARHLLDLLKLELERVRLSAPAIGVTLRATRRALLAERQGALFDEERSLVGSTKLAALVDRLAGRLGREAVLRCQLASDAQPELACREEPLVDAAYRPSRAASLARKRRKKPADQTAGESSARSLERSPLHRPTRLLARPLPIEAIAVAPDGPPIRFLHAGQQHDVAHHWGPERIETGWWRRRTAARDYYRVETTEGRRWWLFRELRTLNWFLHGAFE